MILEIYRRVIVVLQVELDRTLFECGFNSIGANPHFKNRFEIKQREMFQNNQDLGLQFQGILHR
jgi:hypothetical protein